MMRLYNTETRKKQEFKPINDKKVGLYTCGPTVYDYPHLGNYRAYVFTDILKRALTYNGYKVKHIMNLTDVDDKTIKASIAAHKDLKTFTTYYEQAFYEDLEELNIQKADSYPKATDYIPEMVKIIENLLKKDIAYKGEDGSIYYNIKKFPRYGRLAHIKPAELKEGASGRVAQDEYSKENVQDFALWKAWDENDGEVYWDYFGRGRPGWHIECSAMSMKYLGPSFDIHTGGIDLVFPHHQNEIAQSEGATGKPFVKYWLHNGWLLVDGQKMSKSLKNFIKLRDLIEKGSDPLAYRFLCLSAHYRLPMNFTYEALDAATAGLNNLRKSIVDLKERGSFKNSKDPISPVITDLLSAAQQQFSDAVNDDLNTPKALGVVFSLLKRINKEKELTTNDCREIVKVLLKFDKILGLKLESAKKEEVTIPHEVQKLLEERNSARAQKNWQESDRLRDEIEKLGYLVEDSKEGSKVVPVR